MLRTYLVLFVSDMPFFHHWAIEAAMFKGLREPQCGKCQETGQGRPPPLFISPQANRAVTPLEPYFAGSPDTVAVPPNCWPNG